MGNCLGRTKGNNFSGQGRTLGDAPPPAHPVKVPAQRPGRTLGGTSGGQSSAEPQSAAAKAAEERLKTSQGKGKLGKQLDAQKSKTQAQLLAEASAQNRGVRDADAGHEARAYN